MEKLDGKTFNIVQNNIESLKSLFPEVLTDNNIDITKLRQVLGENIEQGKERYDFTWNGKSQAIQIAQKQTTGTLRPCREESVNWETTKNLYLEGDNLEVLRILQNSYRKKVKVIYIDPPYNTGNDFIYEDDFKDNISSYKDKLDENMKSNPETQGRYHTNWLNLIYPRLKIAKNILKDDGVIFVSIDDTEVADLRKIMNEIFGEENFIGQFIWKSRQNKDNRNKTMASIDHEYVLCFGKKLRGEERKLDQYKNPDNDSRGDWTSGNMVGLLPEDQRPNCHYDLINPETGINYGKPEMGWRYDKQTMNRLIEEDRIIWPSSAEGRPRRKVFLSELSDRYTGYSSIIAKDIYTRHGSQELYELFGEKIMQFPKPTGLIKELLIQSSDKDDIVLDFFSGSSSTAEAVLRLNAEDGGRRRFIMVQIPEKTEEKSNARKAGYSNICEVGKDRIRLSGDKIITDLSESTKSSALDVGFKVFKLDETNLKVWDEHTLDIEQMTLEMVDPIKEGRSQEDVIYEILLKYGIDLAVPIESAKVEGKTVFSVGMGYMIICIEKDLNIVQIESIIEKFNECKRIVFYDEAFKDDSVRTNAQLILKRYGVEDVRVI